MSAKQNSAVKLAGKSVLQAVGSQVHANMEKSSPRRIPFDTKSQNAVVCLVKKEPKDIMASSGPGVGVDSIEGTMIRLRLTESISLVKLLERHNDLKDPFHMD